MELRINGHRARTIHVGFYELGTDKVLAATVKNGAAAAKEASIWTGAAYENCVSARFTGEETWTPLGASSQTGFLLGDLDPEQEKNVEIKINLPAPAGRPGENYVPLFMGHGGET